MHTRQRLTELTLEAGAGEPEEVAADILLIYEGAISAIRTVPEPLEQARRLTDRLLPMDDSP